MLDLYELQSDEELHLALDGSHMQPVLLFKHSLVCPASSSALGEYQAFLEQADPMLDLQCCLIKIQEQRALSDAVEERTGVRHESPQALLLVDGKVRWHASHASITASALATAVGSHARPLEDG